MIARKWKKVLIFKETAPESDLVYIFTCILIIWFSKCVRYLRMCTVTINIVPLYPLIREVQYNTQAHHWMLKVNKTTKFNLLSFGHSIEGYTDSMLVSVFPTFKI